MTELNGKSYSIPAGMVFQKYHCAKCGTKLEKEKTHRIVTQYDKDYYQYHEVGTFPLRDYDVYSYRFQCPSCGARISYDEQSIIRRIQKQQGHFVLSSSEIKQYYKKCKERNDNSVLVSNILIPVVFMLIAFTMFYFFGTDRTTKDLIGVSIPFPIFTTFTVVGAIRSYKGNYKSKFKRTYSYEKETQLERLHAYSAHNKSLIDISNKCYCFYCRSCMERSEMVDYIDDGQTAVCPKCGIDSIIPDSIEECVDENMIAQMNEYWF